MILLIAAACLGASAATTIAVLRSARRLGIPNATEGGFLVLLFAWPLLLPWNEVNMVGQRYEPGLGLTIAICGLLGGMAGWFLSRVLLTAARPRSRMAVIAGFAFALSYAGHAVPSWTIQCPTHEYIVSEDLGSYLGAQSRYRSVTGRYADDLSALCEHGLRDWIPQAARRVGEYGYRLYLLDPMEKDEVPPLCAHPVVYGKTALATFVAAGDRAHVYVRDTGGTPPEHWPRRPFEAGWKLTWEE